MSDRWHRIRLAGPWTWAESCAADAAEQNCRLPFTPATACGSSPVRLTRRFHSPTGIEDNPRVRIELVMQSSDALPDLRLELNGSLLCAETDARQQAASGTQSTLTLVADVTGRLLTFNTLCVVWHAAKPGDTLMSVLVAIENAE